MMNFFLRYRARHLSSPVRRGAVEKRASYISWKLFGALYPRVMLLKQQRGFQGRELSQRPLLVLPFLFAKGSVAGMRGWSPMEALPQSQASPVRARPTM